MKQTKKFSLERLKRKALLATMIFGMVVQSCSNAPEDITETEQGTLTEKTIGTQENEILATALNVTVEADGSLSAEIPSENILNAKSTTILNEVINGPKPYSAQIDFSNFNITLNLTTGENTTKDTFDNTKKKIKSVNDFYKLLNASTKESVAKFVSENEDEIKQEYNEITADKVRSILGKCNLSNVSPDKVERKLSTFANASFTIVPQGEYQGIQTPENQGTQTGNQNTDTTDTEVVENKEVRTLIASKSGKVSADKTISATIENDGSVTTKNATDLSKAVSATFTTSLYKVENGNTTTYAAEANLDSASIFANVTSKGYDETKTVDVKQYFDAKEGLKTNITSALMDGVDMSYAKANAKSAAQNMISSMLAENGISDTVTLDDVKSSITQPTLSYKYDYENDYANTKFNLNFADLKEIYKGKFTTVDEYTEAKVPELCENTDESYDQFDEIISGIKMRYHPYTTDSGDDVLGGTVFRAVEFDNSIKNVNIDYANGTYNLSDVYKGGFITGNETNVSYSNMDGATFDGYVNFDMYGTDNKFINHLKTSSEHPTLNVALGHSQPKINLYGYGLEKIIDNYYDNNVGDKLSNLSFDVEGRFDAKDYLNGEHMFDDNGYKNNAYKLSTNAALTMSYDGIRLANVKISGENKTGLSKIKSYLYNIYSEADLSSIKSTGEEYGMMYFVNKPPSSLVGTMEHSKVVIANDNAYNSETTFPNYGALDISGLSVEHQNASAKVADGETSIYFSADNRSPILPANAKFFFFGNSGYKLGSTVYGEGYSHDYTNESWEDLGNAILENPSAGKNNTYNYLKERNLNRSLVSRADTTKTLSPVEKLLLKEQHIYG